MATTITQTLSDMIDETLDHLHRMGERPYEVTVDTDTLPDTTDTTLTIVGYDNVSVTDVLEGVQELMLVTDKSADATPVFTVSRGYAGTPKAAHIAGDALRINPAWPRYLLDKWIRRSISTVMNVYLPNVTSAVMNQTADTQYIEMPTTCVRVLSVRHMNTITGRIIDLPGWQFEQDLPTSVVTSGKALRVPSIVEDTDDLIVTYQTPYTWTGTGDENDTIDLPLATGDLPVLWAAAYASARREVSRTELDKIEEWNREEMISRGYSLRLIRDMWSEFYRRLDEARKTQYVPKHRPYRKMARL